eukprot:g1880.t1
MTRSFVTTRVTLFGFCVTAMAMLSLIVQGIELRGGRRNTRSLLGQAKLTSVEEVRHAAKKVLDRFHQEQLDPDFGDGLPVGEVQEMRKGSEEFWKAVEHINDDDVAAMSDEESAKAQQIIRDVAQLDEDLDNPKNRERVEPEFAALREEFDEMGI